MLSDSECEVLFRAARMSIACALTRVPPPPPGEIPESLCQKAGVFVTLFLAGELRGCIGFIEPVASIYETVCEAAVRAAIEDFRFDPVRSEEAIALALEISVLSPMRRVHDLGEIEIGKHGLLVQSDRHRGLLLPQVATEHGWDRDTFVKQTMIKAGLPPGRWNTPGIRFFVFSADIYHQDAHSPHHH
jgi:AmmeMemoRadiSam system protein A